MELSAASICNLCDEEELTVKRRKYIFEGTSIQHGNDAMELMLRSRSCYKALDNILVLPDDIRTVMSYFGKLGSIDSIKECPEVMSNVFEPLTDLQKYCFIIADEIHIKPTLRFLEQK